MARRRLLLLLATTASALQRPAPKRATVIKRQAHEPKQYQIIAGPACEAMAQRIQASEPARFTYHETSWDKFPDGTDRIVVGGKIKGIPLPIAALESAIRNRESE